MSNVFIHGWSFSSDIWKGLYNGEFIDLPFHGNFRLDYKEKIIENFVNYIGNNISENSTLIGWSLGATVSVLVANKYPEKVKKLILIGFSPKFKDEKLGSPPKFVKAFMFSLKKDFEKTIYNFRKTSCGKEFEKIPLPKKDGAIKILEEFINLDLTILISEISQETILIHGKNDKIVNYQASIFAKEKIKNSTLILTTSNHCPFLENPDIIVNHL